MCWGLLGPVFECGLNCDERVRFVLMWLQRVGHDVCVNHGLLALCSVQLI